MQTVTIACLTAMSAAAALRASADEREFFYPTDSMFTLVHGRWARIESNCDLSFLHTKSLRLLGDGQVEIDPTPEWMADEEMYLEGADLEDLLRTLDDSMHFGRVGSIAETSHTEFSVTVHLDGYGSSHSEPIVRDLRRLPSKGWRTSKVSCVCSSTGWSGAPSHGGFGSQSILIPASASRAIASSWVLR